MTVELPAVKLVNSLCPSAVTSELQCHVSDIVCCIMYSKLSSELLMEAQCLCKNVLRVTSSPSPSNFDQDAMLLHQFSSALNLQLSDGAKLLAVSCIYCLYIYVLYISQQC